jgi:hypothetical protein
MNSDALVEILRINLNTKYYNNEESFLKFDCSIIVIWYLQFIQLLINLNRENDDRQSLIDYLKEYYTKENYQRGLEKVLEFERECFPTAAIDWYTILKQYEIN